MSLDPQVAAFLEDLAAVGTPPLWELPIDEARAQVTRPVGPQPEVADVEDVQADGPAGPIPVRLYVPRADEALDADAPPVMVYFHGGGWVLGHLDAYDGLCRRLASFSGCAVASVDYRLAPEHKYPAALEDCYAATCWVREHASALGVDPERLVVCGDSAGGNLAAAVCLAARERGGPPIRCQVLIYPIVDADFDRPSYRDNAAGYFLTRDAMIWFWDQYLEDEKRRSEPLASPLRADDLCDLPPALVLTAEFDVLRDEGEAYAERLEEAGVPVERLACPGMIHGFLRRTELFDRAEQMQQRIGASVRKIFTD